MKILQINAVYGYKSTGTIVKDIDEMLISLGFDSYVAYQNSNVKLQRGFKVGNSLDYKLHALFTRLIGKQAYCSINSTKKLLKFISEIEPDIIHLHNLHNNFINLNLLLKYIVKNNIKTVITLHDCWFFTGKCFHFDAINCNKWQIECNNCPKLKDDVPSCFFDNTKSVYGDKNKYLNQISDLVIVGVSEWLSNKARESFLKKKTVVTIHNGINIQAFKQNGSYMFEDPRIKDKFIILGFANKWLDKSNKKAVDFILSKLDKKNEIIVLVGCNKQQLRSLPDDILGLGYINNLKTLSCLYTLADVFVNLTLEDSFPTVNIESLCCGTPVITYNSGGSSEIIDLNTGYSVEKGNYFMIWSAIEEVKDKGKVYFSKHCLERCNTHFDKNDRYLDYIELYEKLFFKNS